MSSAALTFAAVLEHLRNGDFSLLAPLFASGPDQPASSISVWLSAGLFEQHAAEAAEALSCACFLGARETAEQLLRQGLDPAGGNRTGMNAVHWAANRGQLSTLRLLLERGAPLEVRNQYGSTVLEQAVWSAIHESRPGQLEAIEELLRAGADVTSIAVPTGDPRIDALLRRAKEERRSG